MKRIFIVYTDSNETATYNNDGMFIPKGKNDVMAIECTQKQMVEKGLKLFESVQRGN